jgi:sulfur relay protein TusB/DsrH
VNALLVVLSKSPWAENLGFILEIAEKIQVEGEKVAVLHIQDAVIAATMSEYCNRLADSHVAVYVLKSDCVARGVLKRVNPKAKVIDYKQWVKLMMNEHDKVVSWTS